MIVLTLGVTSALGVLALAVMGLMMPVRPPDVFQTRPAARARELADWKDDDTKPVSTARPQEEQVRRRASERKRRERLVAKAVDTVLPLPEKSVVAFTMRDDPSAGSSLERHVTNINVVVPDWFSISGNGCELEEHLDAPTQRIVSGHDIMVMPRMANLFHQEWRGAETARMMRDGEARACLVNKVVSRLVALGADGVNVDIEALAPEDTEPLLELLVDLKNALHEKGLRLSVDVSFHDPVYDLESIGHVADTVFVMAYDQHPPTSKPGPLSGDKWFRETLDEALARMDKNRLVIGLGAYCYDWADGSPAESLSFREAMVRARAAGAVPGFEAEAQNTRFAYTDETGRTHEVWCQDALSAWNQTSTLAAKGLSRVALWRLGTEDETLWKFVGVDPRPDPRVLAVLPEGRSVDLFGRGEVLTLRAEPTQGQRELQLDANGRVTRARYSQPPAGFVVERHGSSSKDIALTFDDGPDPEWTPKVLETLDAFDVPGTFFVLGDHVMQYPGLVGDIEAAGHLIGNHTFNHPHLEQLTPVEQRVELDTTARLLEGLVSRRTPLFRAPYTVNVAPSRLEDLAPLRVALENGYVFVGASIDPNDWAKPGADVIVRRMIEQAEAGGRIALLHDSGGDRSQTIAALKIAVPELKKRGYRFVALDQYIGIPRADLFEPLSLSERALAWGHLSVARALSWGWFVLTVLFYGCTVLAVFRVLLLGTLVLLQARKDSRQRPNGFTPWVTVLVPAYNEGKVVERTIASILGDGYQRVEVLVVDDGSTDDTAEVTARMAANEPRVRLLRKPNGGKAHAANHGLRHARGDYVIAVDADTLVTPGSIARLVAHFADPEVTAVCGNVEVGNVNSWLTRFQAIEYVTGQNFDRRAFALLNAISVVPGALGAWRRDKVLAIGGYSSDTLTEDADLTLTMLRAGGRIVYEPRAIGRTEAPEAVDALLKQRFRWTYGTYQCLYKHRKALFHGTLGWIGLPNMVVFQVLFAAICPVGDLVMVLSLIRGDFKAFAAGYATFLLMDVCGSLLAFVLDGKPMRWLWMLLIQRFTYRQMMYWVSLKAMSAVIRGAHHSWRKIDRTGTVRF